MIINHWAVFVCAIFSLVLGALWYSPALFYSAWKESNGFTDEDLKKANPARNFILAFLLAYLMSYNLAYFLGDVQTDWQWGLSAGLLAGVGWAAAAFTTIALFEMRSWKYVAVNCGYIIVYFAVIGLILGAWR